jgi:hypothetical protein
MNGAELVASFGMAPLNNGLGLFIATPSYNGRITFCVTSTREIMPDVTYLVECIAKSFDELLAAGDGTTGKKAKKKSKKKASAARKPVAADK